MTKADTIKRAIIFILGVFLIVDAVLGIGTNLAEIAVGLVLIGIIPIDFVMARKRE